MMGVNVVPASNERTDQLLASDFVIENLPRPPVHIMEAELLNVPVRGNTINVHHPADKESSITNVSGPLFAWRGSFDGSQPYLVVNAKKVNAGKRMTVPATSVTYVDLQGNRGKPLLSQGEPFQSPLISDSSGVSFEDDSSSTGIRASRV
jgi:hypothetical protein